MDFRRLSLPVIRLIIHPWFRLSRGVTLGVRALVFDDRAQILLVSHTYAPGWHLPGGGVERGETLQQALARELAEEARVEALGSPALKGVAANFSAMPGDHVAVYEVPKWRKLEGTPPVAEIREAAFFPVTALPEGTTEGTRRRIAEAMAGKSVAATW